MARRSKQGDPEELRGKLVELLTDFQKKLQKSDLRPKVKALIPAVHMLNDLGCSLVPKGDDTKSAMDRILYYFRKYPLSVITGDELMVVAGISEWARRVRQLRVEYGWQIVSGVTIASMIEAGEEIDDQELLKMKVHDYMLLSPDADRDAAYRWNVANKIRKNKDLGSREKILAYFRENVGKRISGEELTYVTKGAKEWARRTRELRTEYGWPVITKQTGDPNLPVGFYVLEADRQLPTHDRGIKDDVRRNVLKRDDYRCQNKSCNWHIDDWNRADPRFLELHHKIHHAQGGNNTEENLITYCNICHDVVHRDKP